MAHRQLGFQTYDEFKESFVRLLEHESPHKVKLGDDYQYPIKGSRESSYKLDSDGQVIVWPKGNTIDDAIVIGEQERALYKLKGHPK